MLGSLFSLSKIYPLNILITVSIWDSNAWSYLYFNYVSIDIAWSIDDGCESIDGCVLVVINYGMALVLLREKLARLVRISLIGDT